MALSDCRRLGVDRRRSIAGARFRLAWNSSAVAGVAHERGTGSAACHVHCEHGSRLDGARAPRCIDHAAQRRWRRSEHGRSLCRQDRHTHGESAVDHRCAAGTGIHWSWGASLRRACIERSEPGSDRSRVPPCGARAEAASGRRENALVRAVLPSDTQDRSACSNQGWRRRPRHKGCGGDGGGDCRPRYGGARSAPGTGERWGSKGLSHPRRGPSARSRTVSARRCRDALRRATRWFTPPHRWTAGARRRCQDADGRCAPGRSHGRTRIEPGWNSSRPRPQSGAAWIGNERRRGRWWLQRIRGGIPGG